MASTAKLQEIRLIADYKESLRKICKIKFASGDHSLYLIPYAPQREYFFGQRAFPEQEMRDTFDFVKTSKQVSLEPHLSLHESGMVQVYSGNSLKAGPLSIPKLTNLRGQHVASVVPDTFESLPILEGNLRSGRRMDHVMPIPSGVDSGRLAIYINGRERIFNVISPEIVITQKRPTYRGSVYIGIKTKPQPPIGEDEQTGMTILAGWNPELPPEQVEDYLYIRGR